MPRPRASLAARSRRRGSCACTGRSGGSPGTWIPGKRRRTSYRSAVVRQEAVASRQGASDRGRGHSQNEAPAPAARPPHHMPRPSSNVDREPEPTARKNFRKISPPTADKRQAVIDHSPNKLFWPRLGFGGGQPSDSSQPWLPRLAGRLRTDCSKSSKSWSDDVGVVELVCVGEPSANRSVRIGRRRAGRAARASVAACAKRCCRADARPTVEHTALTLGNSAC
jgi:hypothetical protein